MPGLSLHDAWQLTGLLLAGGMLLNSAEWLALLRTQTAGGFARWEVARLRTRAMAGPAGDLLAHGLADHRLTALLLTRASAAIWLAAALLGGQPVLYPLLLLVITGLGLFLRSPYGLDGADQMWHLIGMAMLLGAVIDTEGARRLVLLFIAGQSVLSYAASGGAKLLSTAWRSGTALTGVFQTRLYGHPWLHHQLNTHPSLARGTAWLVIGCQLLGPLLLLLGPTGGLAYIVLFGLFHLFNLVFMGLLWFVLSFATAYPAVYYLSGMIGPAT